MRVVTIHNYYKLPGGEDSVFAAESALLERYGHQVTRYTVHNDATDRLGRLQLAARTVWSQPACDRLRPLLRGADIAHFHNTLPLVSPAAYYAATAANVAVVQTLHNYRLICPGTNFFRAGRPCEDCAGRIFPWPALRHGCYRNSRLASLGVAGMLGFHKAIGTWRRQVDAYICLSAFARDKFAAAGLPGERLFVKPNFVLTDPGAGPGRPAGGPPHALYAGRLEAGKGIDTLLEAWALYQAQPCQTRPRLVIAGRGPMENRVRAATERLPDLEYVGWVSGDRLAALLRDAALQVFPSLFYEGQPTSIIQGFAAGTPVLVSDSPNLAAYADGGRGWRFRPGDAAQLAARLGAAFANPDTLAAMRTRCRATWHDTYSAARGYEALMQVYRAALNHSRRRRTRPAAWAGVATGS